MYREIIMRTFIKFLLVILTTTAILSCTGSATTTDSFRIIPKPSSVKIGKSYFKLNSNTVINYNDSGIDFSAKYLKEILERSSNIEIQLKQESTPEKMSISLLIDPNQEKVDGAYKISVTEELVEVRSSSHSGIFYGIQTLLQLIPPEIMGNNKSLTDISLPTCTILDTPRFQWRGTMLDVARHFFEVEEVKRYIDLISLYKINTLHLHLSDDQGWRIMINSWPNLAIIGGKTEVGGGEGGYYTKNQYREIVKYAQDRFITIVPEIDMPGHTNAILASYPELNPDGIAKKPYTGINVGFSSLDIKNELTYKFVDDVIRELAELTPGKYIHIGGDEAIPQGSGRPGEEIDKTQMKIDYKYFIERVEKIVLSHNKTMIGWDDIESADLHESTIRQIWHLKAKKSKNRAILSPADRAYLDMKYNQKSKRGLVWAGYIDVDKGYNWDPLLDFPNLEQDQILGIEAPLWSETIEDIKDIEYMAFPRLIGYSEIAWSKEEHRNYEDYIHRLATHGRRLDILGVNYYRSELVTWLPRDYQKSKLVKKKTDD